MAYAPRVFSNALVRRSNGLEGTFPADAPTSRSYYCRDRRSPGLVLRRKGRAPRSEANNVTVNGEHIMSEWFDYFEDYPEENPANWVDGQFNPRLAAERRAQEANALLLSAKTAEETA